MLKKNTKFTSSEIKQHLSQPFLVFKTHNPEHASKGHSVILHERALNAMRAVQDPNNPSKITVGHSSQSRISGENTHRIVVFNPNPKHKALARHFAEITGQEHHIESDGKNIIKHYHNGPKAGQKEKHAGELSVGALPKTKDSLKIAGTHASFNFKPIDSSGKPTGSSQFEMRQARLKDHLAKPFVMFKIHNPEFPKDRQNIHLFQTDVVNKLKNLDGIHGESKVMTVGKFKDNFSQPQNYILISNPTKAQIAAAAAISRHTGQEYHIQSDGKSATKIFHNGPRAGKVLSDEAFTVNTKIPQNKEHYKLGPHVINFNFKPKS